MIGLIATAVLSAPEVPTPDREFRAAWVATVDNIDWPSKKGLSSQEQAAEMLSILNKAQSLKLNAIIFQIRPHADSLYESSIEPWSEYLTGSQGKAPNPFWDPLSYMVKEAHLRGIEVHCWFNPYRSWHPAAKGSKAPSYIGNIDPTIVKKYGRYEWMDPGEEKVKKRTEQVMLDVLRRYDIDGIHIDDYFYPYPITENGKTVDFPDGASWGKYRASGGTLSRADWRRENVDSFIENIYKKIKSEKPWVKFGISPFGIYRPGVPAGIKAGVDQYADLYADAKRWLEEGWCDYFAPQLYWPINQAAQAYPKLLEYWLSVNTKNRHIWPGNYTARTNPSDGNWNASEVTGQIRVTRQKQAGGNIHFSMKALMKNWNGISTALAGAYKEPALPPASTWLSSTKPEVPDLNVCLKTDTDWNLSWTVSDTDRFYVLYGLSNGKWTWISTSSVAEAKLPVSTPFTSIAIRKADRVSNLSEPLIVSLSSK